MRIRTGLPQVLNLHPARPQPVHRLLLINQPLAASSRWNGAWRNGNWNAGVNNARPADAGRAARQLAKQTEASQQLKEPTELQNARNDLYSVLHQLQLRADPAKG